MSGLRGVFVSTEAFLVCMSHALTTEKEEVMGLLLGDIKKSARGAIAFVSHVSVLTRSDKRKDRVEIEPAQLTAATAEAERLSVQLGKQIRVVGWYHSHPHITVHPSHVDVNTQAMYQMMDTGFIGLIFSCFNTDAELNGRIQVIAFQSLDLNQLATPEERRNNLAQSGYEQVNVPLTVVPPDPNAPNTLMKLVELQQIISQEDRASYNEAITPPPGGQVHPLMEVFSGAVHQKSVARLLEYGSQPLLRLLKDRHEQNKRRLDELRAEKARLLALKIQDSVMKE
jgi:BRCA1/BRCA2-containing complex subunit 3